MRVALIINAFPTVSETFILRQIVGLLQRGHEVHIYADRPAPASPTIHADVAKHRLIERTRYREPMPVAKGARVRGAMSRILRWGWRCPRFVLECLNVFRYGRLALDLSLVYAWLPDDEARNEYDVIHCHFGPNGQRAVAMRIVGAIRGPIITTFHGYDANLLPGIHGRKMYDFLFRRGEVFTVGSEFMRRRICGLGAPESRIVSLPMGVDIRRYRISERRCRVAGEFSLLTISRLVEVKGVEFAIRAVAIARSRGCKLRLRIAGDGPLRRRLEALAEELGLARTVEFLGAVSEGEALSLYNSNDAFVLSSVITDSGEEENQPVVLAEAQASGLPVIATAIGGVSESMRDGKSGFLVPPRDPEALASAILQLADHPETWGPMGRAGRALVEERFDLEKLNDRLVDVYRMVAEKSCRSR